MSLTIFIPLLDEGTAVWRPVTAVQVAANAYRIDATVIPSDDERWAYSPGELVRCVRRDLSDATNVLVAIARIS
jgi:hypothetical protein